MGVLCGHSSFTPKSCFGPFLVPVTRQTGESCLSRASQGMEEGHGLFFLFLISLEGSRATVERDELTQNAPFTRPVDSICYEEEEGEREERENAE